MPYLYGGFAFYEVFSNPSHTHSLGYVVAVRLDRAESVPRLTTQNLGLEVALREEDLLYLAIAPVSVRERGRLLETRVSGRFLDIYGALVDTRRVHELHYEVLAYIDHHYQGHTQESEGAA